MTALRSQCWGLDRARGCGWRDRQRRHRLRPRNAAGLIVGLAALVAMGPGADRGAAAPWCGSVSAQDRPQAVAGYPIRVVYALSAEGGDRSAVVAPQIAAVVDEIDGWWRREDSSRTPRFDLYTDSCGQQPDITLWRVPTVHAGMTDAGAIFDLLWDELHHWQGAGQTKYLVFFDGATEEVAGSQSCGVAAPAAGSSRMGLAMVFLGSCSGASIATTAAHELLHALGSGKALASAPHACPTDPGHVCDSTGDLLYAYAQLGIPLASLELDVGHDDYYGGSAPVNLQTVPFLRLVNEQMRLTLAISGNGRVSSDVPGLDCGTSCATDWDRGSSLVLSAESGPGQRFVRWGGACISARSSATCDLALDAVKGTTALFAPMTFPVSISVTGRGTVASAPTGVRCARTRCSASFTSHEPVKLTAKAAKGWRLKGWAGTCRGTRPSCTLPMTSGAAVKAIFVKTA